MWKIRGNHDPVFIPHLPDIIKEWVDFDCDSLVIGKSYCAITKGKQTTIYSKNDPLHTEKKILGSWNSIYEIHENFIINVLTNQKIEIANVKSIAGGINHDLVLCRSGYLYAKGSNKYNQIDSTGVDYLNFTKVGENVSEIQAANNRSYIKSTNSLLIGKIMDEELEHLHKYKDFNVALGWNSLCLYKNHDCIVIGKNNLLQLGKSHLAHPKVNHFQMGYPIQKIVAGSEHYLLLCNGDAYGWGWNDHFNFEDGNNCVPFHKCSENVLDIYCGPAVSCLKIKK
eukprot:NODE_199_length_13192_cov_0.539219.p8 type:complete len:283 gc:universal NODE_199_length_13192_cov_0.539219:12328-13176(+)